MAGKAEHVIMFLWMEPVMLSFHNHPNRWIPSLLEIYQANKNLLLKQSTEWNLAGNHLL
jgi:hypothetical protein